MAEIVNLRTARKARDRRAAQDVAAANRARFGRSKAEKQAADADRARLDRIVEGARIVDGNAIPAGNSGQENGD